MPPNWDDDDTVSSNENFDEPLDKIGIEVTLIFPPSVGLNAMLRTKCHY